MDEEEFIAEVEDYFESEGRNAARDLARLIWRLTHDDDAFDVIVELQHDWRSML